MIDKVNEAIDKGWRLREAGPPGVWCLVPADVIQDDVGFTVKESNTFQLIVPIVDIEAWLKARVVHTPEEKLRASKMAEVKAFFHKEWDGYLEECDSVREYAMDIIRDDALSDYKMHETDDKDLVAKWLQEVLDARGETV